MKKYFYLILTLAFTYRIYLCTQTPAVSTDALKNLGFASEFFNFEKPIYSNPAKNYAPLFWSSYWPDFAFVYPPVAGLFFYLFAAFGLGLFWIKLVLTAFDLITTLLIKKISHPFASLVYALQPTAIWYVSHEGQFEPLQSIFIVLALFYLKKEKWLATGLLWGLAIQVKLFALFFGGYFLFEILASTHKPRSLAYFFLGMFAAFSLFLPWYYTSPYLLFNAFKYVPPYQYNPFFWNYFDDYFAWNPAWLINWNATFTNCSLTLLVALLVTQRKKFWRALSHLSPALSFLAVIKTGHWVQFWYMIVYPTLLLPIFKISRRWLFALLFLHFMQGAHSAGLLLGLHEANFEGQESRSRMQRCMFTCDTQQE